MAESKTVERYVVTAPLARFVTLTAQGRAVVDFHQGALAPADATPESIAQHLNRGMIEEVPVALSPGDAKATAEPISEKDAAAALARSQEGEDSALGGPAQADAGRPAKLSEETVKAQAAADEKAVKDDPSPHVQAGHRGAGRRA